MQWTPSPTHVSGLWGRQEQAVSVQVSKRYGGVRYWCLRSRQEADLGERARDEHGAHLRRLPEACSAEMSLKDESTPTR